MENILDLEHARRVRNIQRDIKTFENQLGALKKSATLLEPHKDFYFFSVTCHAINEEKKKLAQELLRLRLRLDRAKNPSKYEFNGETNG